MNRSTSSLTISMKKTISVPNLANAKFSKYGSTQNLNTSLQLSNSPSSHIKNSNSFTQPVIRGQLPLILSDNKNNFDNKQANRLKLFSNIANSPLPSIDSSHIRVDLKQDIDAKSELQEDNALVKETAKNIQK